MWMDVFESSEAWPELNAEEGWKPEETRGSGGEFRMKNSEWRIENAPLPQANSQFSILNSSFCIHHPP
jgi:hypothetical protein